MPLHDLDAHRREVVAETGLKISIAPSFRLRGGVAFSGDIELDGMREPEARWALRAIQQTARFLQPPADQRPRYQPPPDIRERAGNELELASKLGPHDFPAALEHLNRAVSLLLGIEIPGIDQESPL